MAVFLNRNKRPQAAPIEVAELLSEKPPPSHTPENPTLAGRGGSVSRRDHNPKNRKTRPHRRGAQVRRKSQAYSPPLFGREREGGERQP